MGELLKRNASIASATDQTVSPCTSTITITDTGPDIYGATSNVASGQVVIVAVNGTNYQAAVNASGDFQITGIADADAAAADGVQISANTDDGAGCTASELFVFTQCSATISVATNGPVVDGTTTGIPSGKVVVISVNGTTYQGTVQSNGDWAIAGISATDAANANGLSITALVDDGTGCAATSAFVFSDGANAYSIPADTGPLAVYFGYKGYGVESAAGRGGVVIPVTNTNQSGAGSLAEAIETSGNRSVVFAVGGYIELPAQLSAGYGTLSVYGQTAPEPVTIRGMENLSQPLLMIEAPDVLIQHIRVRPGPSASENCCNGAMGINGSAAQRVTFANCSFSWGTDETGEIWNGATDILMYRCLFSEALDYSTDLDDGAHGFHMLIGDENTANVTMHQCAFLYASGRAPSFAGSDNYDLQNCLTYGVTRPIDLRAKYSGETRINMVDCLNIYNSERSNSWYDAVLKEDSGSDMSLYVDGNLALDDGSSTFRDFRFIDGNTGIVLDASTDDFFSSSAHSMPSVDNVPATQLEALIKSSVGATKPYRDAVDTRVLDQMTNRTGEIIDCVGVGDVNTADNNNCAKNAGGWPALSTGTSTLGPAPDYVPTSFKTSNGLTSTDNTTQLDSNSDGYTDFEDWIDTL